jgi:hypothetical protein
MVFLYAVELVVVALFLWIFFTQVLLPLVLGIPTFPIFRGWSKLNRDRAFIQDELAQLETQSELDRLYDDLMTQLERSKGNNSQSQGEQNDVRTDDLAR